MIPTLHPGPAHFACIAPGGFRILGALEQATRALGFDLELTCGTEGHPPTDPHTLGKAYDVKIITLTTAQIVQLVTFLREQLPPHLFTVLLETRPPGFTDPLLSALQYLNPEATGPHIHVQVLKGSVYPPMPPGTVTA